MGVQGGEGGGKWVRKGGEGEERMSSSRRRGRREGGCTHHLGSLKGP